MTTIPSKRYILTGYLQQNEKYVQYIHNYANDDDGDIISAINIRNFNYNTKQQYYSQEVINAWIAELKPAECAICLDNISFIDIANNNCIHCENGHKFHNKHEHPDYSIEHEYFDKCPICRINAPFYKSTNMYDTMQ
jgi:hypothetical protein